MVNLFLLLVNTGLAVQTALHAVDGWTGPLATASALALLTAACTDTAWTRVRTAVWTLSDARPDVFRKMPLTCPDIHPDASADSVRTCPGAAREEARDGTYES